MNVRRCEFGWLLPACKSCNTRKNYEKYSLVYAITNGNSPLLWSGKKSQSQIKIISLPYIITKKLSAGRDSSNDSAKKTNDRLLLIQDDG